MKEPARYRARIAYLGTFFRGWQIQKNAPRTVEAVLEAALSAFDGAAVRAVAAGRTDAGVHADGQVVHFDLARRREPTRLRDGVNALLPWDVRMMDVEEVPPGFHARRDAVWKEYLYRWSTDRIVAPADSLILAPISPRADVSRMRDAARRVEGERDFGVFGVKVGTDGAASTVRRLHFVRVAARGNEIHALFRGDAFLRGMVRSLCGLLADVARGRVPPDRAERLFATGDRSLLSQKAPAQGLTLRRVAYARRASTLRSDSRSTLSE